MVAYWSGWASRQRVSSHVTGRLRSSASATEYSNASGVSAGWKSPDSKATHWASSWLQVLLSMLRTEPLLRPHFRGVKSILPMTLRVRQRFTT